MQKLSESLRLCVKPDFFPLLRTNGPGLRYTIWTQGCSLHCTKRCLNKDLIDPAGGIGVRVGDLLAHLSDLVERFSIDGISVLGGEPTDQAAPLRRLLKGCRELGIPSVVYTGWRLEDLSDECQWPRREALLLADIIVEGPFISTWALPGILWRGSANQRILLLDGGRQLESLRAGLESFARHLLRLGSNGEAYFMRRLDPMRLQHELYWLDRTPYAMAAEGGPLRPRLPQVEETFSFRWEGQSVVSWIPELSSESEHHRLPSPKGVTVLVAPGENARWFGFQDPNYIDKMVAFMNAEEDETSLENGYLRGLKQEMRRLAPFPGPPDA